jgi:predicted metal-dependent peptidase
MGVTGNENGITLVFNPEFVLGLSVEVLAGVLLHEVHHVVLGHLCLDQKTFTDRWAFVVACEVSVNEFVKLPLPEGAIRLEQFPQLAPMESTVDRYRKLQRVSPDQRIPISGAGKPGQTDGRPTAGAQRVIDNHEIWQKAQFDPKAVKEMIAALLREAEIESEGAPPELQSSIRVLVNGSLGHVQFVKPNADATLDWRRLLRRYVGTIREMQGTYARPPRRFPGLAGIVPGRCRRPVGAAIVAIIDTSGSIDQRALEAIDGELSRIRRTRPVMIVEADCVVHRVYRYRTRLEHVHGRGGTDFRPALSRDVLTPLKPDLLVYFTDGFGEAPDRRPDWPLIWCLVPGGKPPATYGRVIRMD